jgi:hypothetical protein
MNSGPESLNFLRKTSIEVTGAACGRDAGLTCRDSGQSRLK